MGNEDLKEIFSDFDALATKEWADAVLDTVDKFNALRERNTHIRIMPIDRIQVENDIDILADRLGAELQEFKGRASYLYYFTYNGHEFTMVSDEPLASKST